MLSCAAWGKTSSIRGIDLAKIVLMTVAFSVCYSGQEICYTGSQLKFNETKSLLTATAALEPPVKPTNVTPAVNLF